VPVKLDGRRRRDPIDRIDVASLDFGVGVLRGAVSLLKPLRDKPDQVEAAIEHVRRAARLIEKLQRERARDRFRRRREAGARPRAS
jgi:hypothetical protein